LVLQRFQNASAFEFACDPASMMVTNFGRPSQPSLLDRIQRRICDLLLSGIAITVSVVVRRGPSARRRLSNGPLHLLVEPSDYVLRNVGDMAMMQIAIERLNALWPDAAIHVLTDDPQRLKILCPGASPLSSEGRQLWLADDFLPRRLQAQTSPELITFMRLRAPEMVRLFWKYKLRYSPDRWRALDLFTNIVAKTDAVVVTGMGGIADAFPEYAHNLLMTLSLALHHRTPVVLVGQGIGPLEIPGLRELAGCVLRRVDMIALRECATGGPLLMSLKVPTEQVITTGDDAIEIAYRARSVVLGAGLGINIRASDYSEVDLELMSRLRIVFEQTLRSFDAVAVPVPISSVPGEADVETFRTLMGDYDGASVEPPELGTPSAIVEQLQQCRILVCGSYHAAVFACSCGIPAVCLAKSAYYLAKFRGLADLFGEGCEFVSLEDPHFEFRLREAIDKCWTSAEQLRPHLLERAEAQMAIGRAAYQKLHGLVSARIDRATTG
jgi:polysaccharide pyruvyl transferase WcaK-like protein